MMMDLKVLNGDLELKFNEYTYDYTVRVEEDITSLELEYKICSECNINIRDNQLDNTKSTVYLDVYDVDSEITYTLHVSKNTSNTVSMIDNYKKSLEVKSEEKVAVYKVQLLSCGLFLLIIVVFSILFPRKR